ncbi:hypothetical protein L6452_29198 [Arctium lappa]|uniref:Uncharacterized protein n=1 Tax=Arctium lappa TaxID=4217 RepID=A0ACB8ZFG9_ARCLA|nr:hypothetical protein L6452_29198 [Arctium lappa]
MGIETVKGSSWFGSIWRPSSRKTTVLEPEKPVIGIMSFEISRLMTKIVNLWQFLSDKQMSRLREELTNSLGTRELVSDNFDDLMDLALIEIVDNIKSVAREVARLGKKCTDPVYNNLDHIFDNLEIDLNWCGWEYRLKKMEKRVKKMKRFAAVTSQLYEELEILSELENGLSRIQENNVNQEKLHEFQKKVMWQREEVGGLREMSVWGRTYDYVIRLLLRSLFTIVERVKVVFGIKTQMGSPRVSDVPDGSCFLRSNSVSALVRASVHPSESSIQRSVSNLGDKPTKKPQIRNYPPLKARSLAHIGPLKSCMMSELDSPVYFLQQKANFTKKRLLNGEKPTLGDAALALHYANVIIFIERLAISPHFISPEAREDLYHMLTTRIKNSLRSKLSLFAKTGAYNRALASDWSSSVQKIIDWLAPLAHNTIKWHSERNFEKQRMDCGGNVLLVNTLQYADQEKSEDAITEVVMGLHYISRFGREINDKAFMGSGCGTDCDDYLVHKSKIASIAL